MCGGAPYTDTPSTQPTHISNGPLLRYSSTHHSLFNAQVARASLKTHRIAAPKHPKHPKHRDLAGLNHLPKNKTAAAATRDRWSFKALLNTTNLPGAVDYMLANGFSVSLANALGEVVDTVTYGPDNCTAKSSNSRRLVCQTTPRAAGARLSLAPKTPAKKYGDKTWTLDGSYQKRTTAVFETGSMPLQVVLQFDSTVVADRCGDEVFYF